MAGYINVTSSDFESKVLQSDVPVLVDFWAPWCGPCRAIAPHLEAVGQELEGQALIAKVNVDDEQQLAFNYKVQSIPKLVLFKGGEVVAELNGMPRNTRNTLKELIEQAL